jgi:hypothetical protein
VIQTEIPDGYQAAAKPPDSCTSIERAAHTLVEWLYYQIMNQRWHKLYAAKTEWLRSIKQRAEKRDDDFQIRGVAGWMVVNGFQSSLVVQYWR